MSDVSDALKVGVTIATGVENAFTKGSPNGAATVQPSLDYTQGGNYNSLGSAIDTYNPTLNYDSSSSQAALSQAVTGSAPPAFGSTDFQLQPPSLDSGADAFNPGP
jgi:hypothetical protein